MGKIMVRLSKVNFIGFSRVLSDTYKPLSGLLSLNNQQKTGIQGAASCASASGHAKSWIKRVDMP
jgi:hypothetical protein